MYSCFSTRNVGGDKKNIENSITCFNVGLSVNVKVLVNVISHLEYIMAGRHA